MALTDTVIKKAQSSGKLQKLSDRAGPPVHIAPTSAKLWRLAYRFKCEQKTLALGAYPDTSLEQARELR